jgi:hypothetical protein
VTAGGLNVKNKISWDGELFLNMALAGGRFAFVEQFWSAYRPMNGARLVREAIASGSGVLMKRFFPR